jgi:hypothetical protein
MTFPTLVGMLYPAELPNRILLPQPMTFPTLVGMLYPAELPNRIYFLAEPVLEVQNNGKILSYTNQSFI